MRDNDDVHAFLNFAHPQPPYDAFRNPQAQRDLVAAVFAALVGAYIFADSLVDRNHTAGLAAYEYTIREFVPMNQDQVGEGDATLVPSTARGPGTAQRHAAQPQRHAVRSGADRPIPPSPCPSSCP